MDREEYPLCIAIRTLIKDWKIYYVKVKMTSQKSFLSMSILMNLFLFIL